MNMKRSQKRWHPINEAEEDNIANSLLEYASKDGSLTWDSYADLHGIDVADVEDLVLLEGYLPNAFYTANTMMKVRLDQIGAFMQPYGEESDGNFWRELWLENEATGKWFLKCREQIA